MIGLTEECKQTAAADYRKGYLYVHLISIAIQICHGQMCGKF